MKRRTSLYLASAVMSAGLFVGCSSDQHATMLGNGSDQGTSAPVMYGVNGNRSATVPPADAAAGTGDHTPAENLDTMGAAAYNGAGSQHRPAVSDKAGIANQPAAPNVVGNGGPVGSSPVNSTVRPFEVRTEGALSGPTASLPRIASASGSIASAGTANTRNGRKLLRLTTPIISR